MQVSSTTLFRTTQEKKPYFKFITAHYPLSIYFFGIPGGGGDFYIKRKGLFVENFEKNPFREEPRSLFCGLNVFFFHP